MSCPRRGPNRCFTVQVEADRAHRRIEIMHCDRNLTLGEDRHTNRLDHAPGNILILTGRIATSPTRAIKMIRDNQNGTLRTLAERNSRLH